MPQKKIAPGSAPSSLLRKFWNEAGRFESGVCRV
jgi:hypothetical protein